MRSGRRAGDYHGGDWRFDRNETKSNRRKNKKKMQKTLGSQDLAALVAARSQEEYQAALQSILPYGVQDLQKVLQTLAKHACPSGSGSGCPLVLAIYRRGVRQSAHERCVYVLPRVCFAWKLRTYTGGFRWRKATVLSRKLGAPLYSIHLGTRKTKPHWLYWKCKLQHHSSKPFAAERMAKCTIPQCLWARVSLQCGSVTVLRTYQIFIADPVYSFTACVHLLVFFDKVFLPLPHAHIHRVERCAFFCASESEPSNRFRACCCSFGRFMRPCRAVVGFLPERRKAMNLHKFWWKWHFHRQTWFLCQSSQK